MAKALVIGFGVSGKSAAKFLCNKGYEVETYDKDPEKKGAFVFYSNVDDVKTDYDLAVLSPGVPLDHPLVKKITDANIELIGEIELACRYLSQPMIGITGTNGKTTVTLLVTHVLNSCGIKAIALGNVGTPLTTEIDQNIVIVCELSSYQLETLISKPLNQAAILNITPDHLDRYHSMDRYAEAKFLIQRNIKNDGLLVVDKRSIDAFGNLHHFKNTIVVPSLKTHDLENAYAAFELVKPYGITEEEFNEAYKTFRKPPHRIEYIAEYEGVKFYDDSKGTNIDATLRAVSAINEPLVLIAGGVDKGFPYSGWIEPFKGKVKKIIAIGAAAPKIEKDLKEHIPVECVSSLKEATLNAFQSAKKGETVLLSPGCSSLDMFKDYADRGRQFQAFVRGLIEGKV
jgi:UDP-N-acetylmuramoylalanine--D-glutamate ligase